MQPSITVSALNEQIKNLLEATFLQVAVEGELSRITYHNSGHIYFTLKDPASALSGVMFRGNASRLRFRLEEGMKVIVYGGITLYKPRGTYQINAVSIEPAGHGALALAYEQLKKRLAAEGLFDRLRKKPIPPYPERIAVVTSATGAALQDIRRVAASRWPLSRLHVFDALVQGEEAADSLRRALEAADAGGRFDVIVIGRGGGSMEDLWAFNDERLARAIAAAATPVVSAVGHEIDSVISDFVADLRAPTPSAAIQMILPDQNEVLMHLDQLQRRFDAKIDERLKQGVSEIRHLHESYVQHSVDRKLQAQMQTLASLKENLARQMAFVFQKRQSDLMPMQRRMDEAIDQKLRNKQMEAERLGNALQAQSPEKRDKKGFAQIVKNGRPVSLSDVQEGDMLELMDSHNIVSTEVKHIKKTNG